MTDLRRRIEPAVRLAQTGLPGRILGRLIEVQFLDRAVILAAQAFSAILPLFIVVSTISPHPGGDSLATVLAGKLGLGAAETSSLQSGAVPPPSARASIGILGVVLALLTATSFARALQRSYQLAWRLPPVGPPGDRWPWWSASPSTSSCCSCSAAWSAACRPARSWRTW
jgi:membrane protein